MFSAIFSYSSRVAKPYSSADFSLFCPRPKQWLSAKSGGSRLQAHIHIYIYRCMRMFVCIYTYLCPLSLSLSLSISVSLFLSLSLLSLSSAWRKQDASIGCIAAKRLTQQQRLPPASTCSSLPQRRAWPAMQKACMLFSGRGKQPPTHTCFGGSPDPNTSAKVSRYKWEAYRDTNWRCIHDFLPSVGHTFAKALR